MKTEFLLLSFLCFTLALKAQETKTVDVTASGSLSKLLTHEELASVTDLTLTGTIDARDFKIMRDSMPALTNVNLSEATIAAYSGNDGTYWNHINYIYPANEIPVNCFYNKPMLLMVTMPFSATSIGNDSFTFCIALTTVNIPSSVVSIGNYAFSWCINLTNIRIPSSVTDIGSGAFHDCYALTSITIPSSVTSIKEATFCACRRLNSISIPSSLTSIGNQSFSYCPDLVSITIPSSVTSIGSEAFNECIGLTSIAIPASVTSIGYAAFYGCIRLTSITVSSGVPVDVSHSWNVFKGVDTATCKLMVPYQSKARYAAAAQWKDFTTIEEATSGLALDVSHLEYDAADHSYSFEISANVPWTISASQPWLSMDVSSGIDNQRATLTIEANPSLYRRKGQITISAPDSSVQIITITQEGQPKTIPLTAGSLLSFLTDDERKGITNLTLEGTIDARDFKVLRDQMPSLTTLDLSHTTVVAYSGAGGTTDDDPNPNYEANTIPGYAFFNKNNYGISDHIKTIVLPPSITVIDIYSFTDCNGLTSIFIPEGVKEINDGAFYQCANLTSVTLPSSLIVLGNSAFAQCTSLKTIDIPSGVKSIGGGSFYYCTSLESVYFPTTLTSIGRESFNDCLGLTSITASSCIPVDLSKSADVFSRVDKNACKLMVPYQSKARYAAAAQWQDFNIVESASGISLDVNHLEFDSTMHRNTFVISANVGWTVSSSQPWLSIDMPLGNGDHQVTFTLEANPTYYTREAQITVSSPDATSQIITVIQYGQTKTIKLTAGLLFSLLTYEEMKGITYLTLEGTIDARDFKVLRDRMPSLTTVDLSHTTIVAYTGTECTYPDPLSIIYYPADKVPDYAFFNIYSYTIKDNLKSIVLPMTIKSIGEAAFKDCDGLTSIEIPEGVTEIETSVFSDCINLTSISLPSTLNKIGPGSFYRCLNLRSIYAYNATPVVIQQNNEVFLLVDQESCILHVPAGSRKDYYYAYQWRDFKHIVDLPTATNELKLNYTQVTCYPNPFIDQISIEIANPAHKEVNIDIYSISGQKIRSLVRAQKGANISCTWNGEDEDGRKVVPGMYLLKVNGETGKVVKR